MSYYKYNDNELLYLISINNEDALEILIKKYYPLIKSRIRKFNIKECNSEDFFQECLITFFKVLHKFRDDKNGIFTLYLDYAIQEKIKYLLNKERDYFYNVVILDNLDDIIEEKIISQSFEETGKNCYFLSEFEESIYEKYYLKNESPRRISLEMLCEEKKIYNAISRINKKINNKKKSQLEIIKKVNLSYMNLTKLESEISSYYCDGYNVREIALIMNCDERKVLNTLTRVKYKIENR